MTYDNQYDELPEDDFILDLLSRLEGDFPEPPRALSERTIRKVHDEITSRDLVELTTFVFLMRFCAPLLDLFAVFLGEDPGSRSGTARPRHHSQSETRDD